MIICPPTLPFFEIEVLGKLCKVVYKSIYDTCHESKSLTTIYTPTEDKKKSETEDKR